MAGKGGAIPGSGRKPKADEMRIRDLLSPYIDDTIKTVVNIMQNGEKEADRLSAAKLLLSYVWGQPKQQVDVTTDGDKITGFDIIIKDATSSRND